LSRLYHLVVRSAGSGASDCKLQPGIAGGQAMESMENTRHQGLSCRLALMISRIVSQFLFDVRSALSSTDPKRMFYRARGPFALNHFLIRLEDR
jgi:hypothetical protein